MCSTSFNALYECETQLRLGVFYLYNNSPKQGEDALFYVMTQQV